MKTSVLILTFKFGAVDIIKKLTRGGGTRIAENCDLGAEI